MGPIVGQPSARIGAGVGNGELIRQVRMGGAGGLQAVQELGHRAQTGALSAAEAAQVLHLAEEAGFGDAFKELAPGLASLARGANEPLRDARALTPNLGAFRDAAALPERFLSDFTLVRAALLEFPGLTHQSKAERAWAFFAAYGEQFAALTRHDDGATSSRQAAADKALARFDKALALAGFGAIRAADGRSGVELARALLAGKAVSATGLTAPEWKDNPGVDAAHPRSVAGVEVMPVIITAVKTQAPTLAGKTAPEEEARHAKRTDKVLGGRMLWNVLHLLRGDDLSEVEKKDAMTQLAIAAALLLGLASILVGLLVLL